MPATAVEVFVDPEVEKVEGTPAVVCEISESGSFKDEYNVSEEKTATGEKVTPVVAEEAKACDKMLGEDESTLPPATVEPLEPDKFTVVTVTGEQTEQLAPP
ncbi:hypothetical protein R6Q59_006006 [Mikania micrantha]